MKKLFSALILCAAMLCGCSTKSGEEISEADVPDTASVTVTAEISAATVTERETTTTAKETTAAEPAEEEIILTPIPSKEPFEIPSCRIIDYLAAESEESFPDKEAIKRAREICFEKERKEIELYNNNFEYAVETAEDIVFSCGLAFDFDGDKSYEYVIALDHAPLSPMAGGFLILMDGSEFTVFVTDCGDISAEQLEIISSGDLHFAMVTCTGGNAQVRDIYSFENNKPQTVLQPHSSGPHSVEYKNGIFYLTHKYGNMAEPFILCGDGVFRQLGREKITREDFESHVRNGGKYIDSLSENGEEITDIYTYGYYNYKLYGEGFRYDVYGEIFSKNNALLTERYDCDGVHGDVYFTDEVVYGDVWAVQATRSQNYDIGGGYVCYTTEKGEDKILNVAKDNNITDSINLNNMCFDPDWQIDFYDMNTPPCFALEVGSFVSVNHQAYFIGSIYYRTYFVIDGKITEMNWTLDGERLDTVDYTKLKCRGEGDEFVSYSAPSYEYYDTLERYRFSFANGSYTDIAGHTEKAPKPEGSAAVADELIDKLSELYFDVLNFELPCRTDEQNIKYYNEEDIMNALCEFCTKPVAEEFFNIVSRELRIVDDRLYSYDEAPAWFPPRDHIEAAEEKDGVITARLFSYYSGHDIPYNIRPPVYAEFVREDGVWKISSLPKEK